MLLYPDPDIPNHFKTFEDKPIFSYDAVLPEFGWSRVIRMNYIENRGFSAFHSETRIGFRDTDGNEVSADVAPVILSDTAVDRCAIIHYYGDMSIACIITNVDPSVFQRLNPAQKLQYYDFS